MNMENGMKQLCYVLRLVDDMPEFITLWLGYAKKLLKILFRGGVYSLCILLIIVFMANLIQESFDIEDAKMLEIFNNNFAWFIGLCTGSLAYECIGIFKTRKPLE
jgi:hypothetical protein